MATYSGDNIPAVITKQFGDLISPKVPKENRIIEYNDYGIPEVKIGQGTNNGTDNPGTTNDYAANELKEAKAFTPIATNPAETVTKVAAKLSDGDILISTINCGIICKPKEVHVEDKFFVIILTKEDSQKFILYPGTKLNLEFKNINGKDSKFNVYYSGIRFEYNSDIFIVFHEVSNNEI